ncbi:hypothetical protein ABGB12_30945 [Actinocorallia sp. B10E7]|uniref:protein kinase domain-containing protein n=1 Tax=Actinocorallia sp. B10E7 TaxID=3153558 RepID=UPI00325DDEB5
MTLAGYEEITELCAGARGRVVLARHLASGEQAVVRHVAARFDELRGEAEVLAGLGAPGVVGVRGFQSAPDGGALILDPVEGVDLHTLLGRYRVLAPEAALRVLKDSLLALGAVHGAGVLHRDYRPVAVVVQPDGTTRLTDFGVTRPDGPDGAPAAPDYPAPEQRTGSPADPFTDVYAATAVFAECLTGDGGDRPLPEELRPLVRRGMAARPEDRPGSALEFAAELEETAVAAYGPDWERLGTVALAGAVTGMPPAPDPVRAASPPAVSAPPPPAPEAARRGRLSRLGGLRTLVAVLVGVLVGLAAALLGTGVLT